MTSTNKRFVITVLVMAVLVGGSGLAIIYEALTDPAITLSDSPIFNIWIGAILGFGGAIMAVIYVEQPKEVKP